MKRIFAALIFCSGMSAFAAQGQLANEGKAGLYAKSVERVMRLDENHFDLATASLLISQHWNPNLRVPKYREKIDEMAWTVKERSIKQGTGTGPGTIAIINQYLYNELGYKAVTTADDPRDLFLDSVIDRRQGYCLSLSILYLSLAERLALPVYGVVVPGHFFVRYDNGATRFNIETTSGGATSPDSHYVEKFKVTGTEPDSIYLKNLSKKQTLGCLFNNLGNLYQDANNIEAATWSLEAAVEINPSLALSHTNLGNVYLKRGLYTKALDEYNTALHINSDDAKTHNNLGNALSSMGKYDEAIRQYKISLDLDPNLSEAYRNIANSYRLTGNYIMAINSLKKAMTFENPSDELFAQMGEVYLAMKDYDDAIGFFMRAMSIKPTCGCSANLAYAYLQNGQIDRAIAQYNETLRLDPLNASLYCGLAQAYGKIGKDDEKIAAYKQAISVNPKMTEVMLELGNAYLDKKMNEAACQEYKKALKLDPDNSRLYYNLGVAYSRMDKYKEASAQFEKAVKLDPKFAEAHGALAVSYYMLKQYDIAWQHAKIAKKLGFDVPKDLYRELYRKMN